MSEMSEIIKQKNNKIDEFKWYASSDIGGFNYLEEVDILFNENTPKEEIFTGKVVDIDSNFEYWDDVSLHNFYEIVMTKDDPEWENKTMHIRKIGYCVEFSDGDKRWYSISRLYQLINFTRYYKNPTVKPYNRKFINGYMDTLCNIGCPYCQIKTDDISDSEARRRVITILMGQDGFPLYGRSHFNISCMCLPCQDAFSKN